MPTPPLFGRAFGVPINIAWDNGRTQQDNPAVVVVGAASDEEVGKAGLKQAQFLLNPGLRGRGVIVLVWRDEPAGDNLLRYLLKLPDGYLVVEAGQVQLLDTL